MSMRTELTKSLNAVSGTFASAVNKALMEMADDVDQKVNFVIGEMLKRLVYRTPVGDPDSWGQKWRALRGVAEGKYKEGHARANWTVQIASPRTSDIAGVDPAGNATIQRGLQVLDGAGHFYWICNAASWEGKPYIMDLEYGYSDQAPLGMARQTIAEFRSIFARAKLGISSNASGSLQSVSTKAPSRTSKPRHVNSQTSSMTSLTPRNRGRRKHIDARATVT